MFCYYAIPPEEISKHWDDVLPLLLRSNEWSPKQLSIDPNSVLLDLLLSKKQLWVTHEDQKIQMMMITERRDNSDTGEIICILYSMAGENFKQSAHIIRIIAQWAKSFGATKLVAYCRPAIFRFARTQGFVITGKTEYGQLQIELNIE